MEEPAAGVRDARGLEVAELPAVAAAAVVLAEDAEDPVTQAEEVVAGRAAAGRVQDYVVRDQVAADLPKPYQLSPLPQMAQAKDQAVAQAQALVPVLELEHRQLHHRRHLRRERAPDLQMAGRRRQATPRDVAVAVPRMVHVKAQRAEGPARTGDALERTEPGARRLAEQREQVAPVRIPGARLPLVSILQRGLSRRHPACSKMALM